jgi:nucleoside-diphosphate-sugar epimerase
MKILFTGSSSFTGYWFIKSLVDKGHEVHAVFTGNNIESYEGIRKKRVEMVTEIAQPVWNCKFGDQSFIKYLQHGFDALCHHAADVTNYKSPDFDFITALDNNTHNIKQVFETLTANACKAIVSTGSVFEQDEGAGDLPHRAFSPYGLSKGLTYEVFKYYCAVNKIKLGKFVIPNPFGPYEDPRFTAFLMKKWKNHEVPEVKTPKYVRDNIHVSLLARVYSEFLEYQMHNKELYQKINPSGYAESQGEFTGVFAKAMKARTGLECEFRLLEQTDFIEPLIRINKENAKQFVSDWNEEQAWDEIADYYMNKLEK